MPGAVVLTCGDGPHHPDHLSVRQQQIDPGETCDDGNFTAGDGCDRCLSECGNGRLDDNEQCEDGNVVDTDACTVPVPTLAAAMASSGSATKDSQGDANGDEPNTPYRVTTPQTLWRWHRRRR